MNRKNNKKSNNYYLKTAVERSLLIKEINNQAKIATSLLNKYTMKLINNKGNKEEIEMYRSKFDFSLKWYNYTKNELAKLSSIHRTST